MTSILSNTLNYYSLKRQAIAAMQSYIKENIHKPEKLWISSFLLSDEAKAVIKPMKKAANACLKKDEFELFLHEMAVKFREFNVEKHEEYCDLVRKSLSQKHSNLTRPCNS